MHINVFICIFYILNDTLLLIQLFGYSLGDSFPFHRDTQFNLAEIGAVSSDMPYMAKALVQRLKNDPRVNFKRDWKLVTLTIGGNDFCSFICLMKDPESMPRRHRVSLTKALRYLRDHLPRFEHIYFT